MDFQTIFNEYYVQYRVDSDIPGTDDDEWAIAIQLANQAIRAWDRVDAVFWEELMAKASDSDADTTLVANQTAYGAPSDMRSPGGWVFFRDADGKLVDKLKVVKASEAQQFSDDSAYAYFTGNPNTGFTLTINPAPTTDQAGLNIEYDYVKMPTTFATDEDGTTKPDMSDPNYIVQYILASQFRGSRNWPAYQTAKQAADTALSNMINENTAGTTFNAWGVADPDGGSFGV
jgi:hypothetical protein